MMLCLIILPLIYVGLFARFRQIFSSGDFMFQAQRMEELYQDVIHGVFVPRISSYTMNQVGSGINFFYPWITLYPFVIIRLFIHDPILSFYLFVLFYVYCTEFVAYFCMKRYSGVLYRSFFFTILYTFSNYHFYLLFNQFVVAEAIAFTFLPLALLGFYETFFDNKNQWPLLAVGMTLIIYSHTLSTVLICGLFVLLLIINFKRVVQWSQSLVNCFKAVILCVLLSSFYVVPFVMQGLQNKVRGSWTGLMFVQTPMETISNSLDNVPTQVIGFVLLLTVFLGAFFWKQAAVPDKNAYIVGITLVALTTTLFPWSCLKNTFVAVLQFPYRLNSLATLMLAIYASFVVEVIARRVISDTYFQKLFSGFVVLLVFCLNLNSSVQIIHNRLNSPRLTAEPTLTNYLPSKSSGVFNVCREDWHNLFYYFGHNGSFDYYPTSINNKVQKQIVTHQAIVNGHQQSFASRITSLPNKLRFDLTGIPAGTSVDLPVIYYHNDVIKVATGTYHVPSVTAFKTIRVNVPQHHKVVEVKYHDSLVDSVAMVISAVSWIALLIVVIS